jgi:hypothetical protein
MIVEYLDQPALNALCRTCHATHGCFQAVLFRYNVEHKRASGLFWAAVHNRPDITTSFLDDYGADVNAAGVNGDTALHHAVRHGNNSVVRCLLQDKRINANRKNVWNGTALYVVVQNLCYLWVARPGFSRDTEANVQHSKEGSPSWATQYTYIISLLLDSGIDINVADCTGSIALHILAPLTFSNDLPHRTRPKPIFSNRGLCRNVHENAFCANVYPLGSWYIGTAPSVLRSPTLGRARTFWREVMAFNNSCAYTKKWHITQSTPDLRRSNTWSHVPSGILRWTARPDT